MIKTELDYEILTPLSIGGANKSLGPELRPPSLKGAMRFWWRAIRGDLDLDDLRKKEAEIFGSSDEAHGRSRFSLRISGHPQEQKLKIPIGGNQTRPAINLNCFKPGQQVKITIISNNESEHALHINILKIALALGGLGKRSRRGLGSLYLLSENGDMIEDLSSIKDVLRLLKNNDLSKPDNFIEESGKIVTQYMKNQAYPYVKEIEIGKRYKDYGDFLQAIANSAHNNNSDFTGYAKRIDRESYRLSSPIYVSALPDNGGLRPVITTLNFATNLDQTNNKIFNPVDKSIAFKGDIL